MRYYHRPNIGDVIYALPVIQRLGAGTLYLDALAEPSYSDTFQQAIPFLRRQPYITDCRLYAGEDWDCDLVCLLARSDLPQPARSSA